MAPIPNDKTALTGQEQLRFDQPDPNRRAEDIKTDAKIIESSREAIRRSMKLLKDIDGDRK